MDGLLLDTESKYTKVTNEILSDFNVGRELTWDVKIKLQGRPGAEASAIIVEEYGLPITPEELRDIGFEKQAKEWPQSKFLPGALELLHYLYENGVPIALGTSSNKLNFDRKTGHLKHGFNVFEKHIVTGDDARIPPGRGKPHPDIWAACLGSLNEGREDKIKPEECIVFEDGIPGVQAGRSFNSHVVWIPDINAIKVLDGKEHEIIGPNGKILQSLEEFDPKEHGF